MCKLEELGTQWGLSVQVWKLDEKVCVFLVGSDLNICIAGPFWIKSRHMVCKTFPMKL